VDTREATKEEEQDEREMGLVSSAHHKKTLTSNVCRAQKNRNRRKATRD